MSSEKTWGEFKAGASLDLLYLNDRSDHAWKTSFPLCLNCEFYMNDRWTGRETDRQAGCGVPDVVTFTF